MRNTFLLLSFLFVGFVGAIAQNKTLGVGVATPNPNAALHVESPTNNQGFIMPRLTTTQRLSMTLTPSDMGLMVYDITETSVFTWDGTVWNEAGRISYPYVDTVLSAPNNSNLLRIVYGGSAVESVGIAQFSNLNPNNNFNPLFVTNVGINGAGYFQSSNTASASPTLRAINNSDQSTAHAIYGQTTGIGASAGKFIVNNASSTAVALDVTSNSLGTAGNASVASFSNTNPASANKPAVYVKSDGTQSFVAESATGWAITGKVTAGQGNAVSGYTTSSDPGSWGGNFTAQTGTAVYASTASNVGGALAPVGVYGESTGTGSVGGAFWIQNATNDYPALYANTIGTGPAFRSETGTGFTVMQATHTGTVGGAAQLEIINAGNTNAALDVSTVGTGAAIMAKNEGTGNGFAGLFVTTNSGNTYPGVQVEVAGNNSNAIYVNHTGTGGNFVTYTNGGIPAARIDKAGVGYFNGGTQNSGADVAEMFEVEGERNQYEPGDVLVISENTDRTVEKSSTPVSTKIAGVYATKPGVLLTEKSIEEKLDDLVPMGVVGVIPTKVCLENGPIKRGDLLVTSSIKGHAMKAKPVVINGVEIYPTGAILGKALENFESGNTGLIKVLVNVK